jgi:putative component of toxin-antitoxin plasmid stabilization module
MKYKLVRENLLSDKMASVYIIEEVKSGISSLDSFIRKYNNSFKDEIINILIRLKTIGKITGAREQFFKLNEGIPGDGVCALFDEPEKRLRLYCSRYGSLIIIVGGGGDKPKNMRALQESSQLATENYRLRKFSVEITKRIKARHIQFSDDGMHFKGDLEFEI